MSVSKKTKGSLIVIGIPVVIILVIIANSLFFNLTVDLVPGSPDMIVISNPFKGQRLEITDKTEIDKIVGEINGSTIVGLSLFGLPSHPESGSDRRITFDYGDYELTCRFDGNHFETNIRGSKKTFFLAGTPLDPIAKLLDAAEPEPAQ